MTDVMTALAQARRRVDEASGQHARAQAQADAAAEDARRILGVIATEFDVSSAAAAQELLASYGAQIAEQVQIIESALAEAEGGSS